MSVAAPDHKAMDTKIVQMDRAKELRGFPFVTLDEMEVEPPAKKWLIKGILARGETSAWIAPPGAMKSALMAEAAICVGAGLDWHGYRNKGAVGVVYFALERADLVKRRLRAHRQRLGLAGTPICVSGAVIDFTKPDSIVKIIQTIEAAEAILGTKVGFILFDTFAKLVAACGGDENSAKDQGVIFAAIQRLKNYTGVHVALIGHTGKDETRGARGSNALLGDVDVMVTVSGDEIRTATVAKANDGPEGALFSFKSEIHDFGMDEDGDPITVNVVSGDLCQTENNTNEPKLTANQQTFFRILHDFGPEGLTTEDWNEQARAAGIGTTRKATLFDLRKALQDREMVREYGGRWKVRHE